MEPLLINPEVQGWYFNTAAIGAIRRAESLRAIRGVNLAGLRVIFELMDEFGRGRPTSD